jgi:hypothetical protein
MKVARLSALRTGLLYPQDMFAVLIYVRGWVNPSIIVLPERLGQRKIPMTPSGIDATTFRLVAQCLNQLRHRALDTKLLKNIMHCCFQMLIFVNMKEYLWGNMITYS